jgi:hypothetical protein
MIEDSAVVLVVTRFDLDDGVGCRDKTSRAVAEHYLRAHISHVTQRSIC